MSIRIILALSLLLLGQATVASATEMTQPAQTFHVVLKAFSGTRMVFEASFPVVPGTMTVSDSPVGLVAGEFGHNLNKVMMNPPLSPESQLVLDGAKRLTFGEFTLSVAIPRAERFEVEIVRTTWPAGPMMILSDADLKRLTADWDAMEPEAQKEALAKFKAAQPVEKTQPAAEPTKELWLQVSGRLDS